MWTWLSSVVFDQHIWKGFLALLPAWVGGAFALWRYVDELKWKRQQYATTLFKEFAAKDTTKKAMMMIDWVRPIELFPKKRGPASTVLVDDHDLVAALSTTNLDFSDKHTAIRDIFDAFLSDLSEFEHHIGSRLMKIEQVAPYLTYWAKTITGNGTIQRREEIWFQLDDFMRTYDYLAVPSLFKRMGYEYQKR